jgi:ubiquinone/menaquinone biosynthesis C-methylase UbiE
MKMESGIGSNKDWGSEKAYLHSTRQYLWNNDYFEFLVKCVWKIDKPVKIIDLGCGYGYLARILLPLVQEGSTYKGIDISEELIVEAKEIFENNKTEVCFEVADINDYESAAEYDIAICQSMLRHLNNPEHILKKMVNFVKDNGLVICIEPSRRMENAGIFIDNKTFDTFENDDFLKKRWLSEEQSGVRDYQVGMKVPIYMKKLGLKNIGVRINDYVDFISADDESFEAEKRRFIRDHSIDPKYSDSNCFLAARCHVISFGYK